MAVLRKASVDPVELVRVLGMQSAYELLKRYAGSPWLYVPKVPTIRHRITLVLGFPAAQKLSDAYGGVIVKLPTDRALVMNDRNIEITRLVEAGESYSEVGRIFGLTRQQVKNISIGDTAGKRNK